MKYCKKPVEIEAVHFRRVPETGSLDWEYVPPWLKAAEKEGKIDYNFDDDGKVVAYQVYTLECMMQGGEDTYLIKGVDGELYPYKGDNFRKIYEAVEDSEKTRIKLYHIEQDIVNNYLDQSQDIPDDLIADYLMTAFPDSCFAANRKNYPEFGLEDMANQIYKTIRYEVLDWCGCGAPEDADKQVIKYLTLISEPWKDKHTPFKEQYEQYKAMCKEYFGCEDIYDNPLLLCLAYTMDAARLTEHGTSIGGAWLEERGKIYLYALKKHIEQEEKHESPNDSH